MLGLATTVCQPPSSHAFLACTPELLSCGVVSCAPSLVGGRMLLDDGQSGVASDARSFFRWQSRANYAGDDVPTVFCAWDSSKRECNIENYAEVRIQLPFSHTARNQHKALSCRVVCRVVTQSISLLALPAACVGIFLMIAFTIAFTIIHTLRCTTSCRLCWDERRCETIVLNTCLGVSCFVMLCVSPPPTETRRRNSSHPSLSP